MGISTSKPLTFGSDAVVFVMKKSRKISFLLCRRVFFLMQCVSISDYLIANLFKFSSFKEGGILHAKIVLKIYGLNLVFPTKGEESN